MVDRILLTTFFILLGASILIFSGFWMRDLFNDVRASIDIRSANCSISLCSDLESCPSDIHFVESKSRLNFFCSFSHLKLLVFCYSSAFFSDGWKSEGGFGEFHVDQSIDYYPVSKRAAGSYNSTCAEVSIEILDQNDVLRKGTITTYGPCSGSPGWIPCYYDSGKPGDSPKLESWSSINIAFSGVGIVFASALSYWCFKQAVKSFQTPPVVPVVPVGQNSFNSIQYTQMQQSGPASYMSPFQDHPFQISVV